MAKQSAPLEVEIRRRIAGGGPIAVAPYMELCLTHPERGYYTSGDPFGVHGDFVTAPEISQMFGELVGLWAAAVWRVMESPERFHLVELGPGRGTMMNDVLRVAKVMPGFRAAIALHMIEISPALERLQRQALSAADVPVSWHRSIEDVPDGPLIVLANEFFDALPIHQAVMCADGWHQRVIKIGEDDRFQFGTERDPIPLFDKLLPRNLGTAKIGDIFEWRADNIALEIGRRVVRFGADHRLRPCRERDRRHAASRRPAPRRRSAADAGRGRSHRACGFSGAGAGGRGHGRPRARPGAARRAVAPARHRATGGRAQGQRAARLCRHDRSRTDAPHR
jgi:hypothetical protein